jgi:hypothetical protein
MFGREDRRVLAGSILDSPLSDRITQRRVAMWRVKLRPSLLPVFLGAVLAGMSPLPLSSIVPGGASRLRPPGLPLADGPQDSVGEQPLFSSNDLIEFVLEANWDELDDDRGQESPERPGQVLLTGPDGEETAIPIKLNTRGIFRLKRSTCPFPPLRLNFPSEGTDGTVFQGQDKLKLVTHCRDQDRYEQNVMEEFLAYRLYNLLTDISLRVRPASITYVDSRGEDDPVTRLGFLIEDDDALAARLDGMMVEVEAAPASAFHQEQAALMYVFNFMIGNTDWSMTRFHNVKVMRIGSDYYPLPYDFDWAGLVDPPYAGPNPQIAHLIDDIRERLYWGICNDAIDYQAIFSRFQEKKDAVLALPASVPGLSERNQRSAVRYLDDFYDVIDSEGSARRQIVSACRR